MHNPEILSQLTSQQMYDLVLQATESEDKATKAARARAMARMRNNQQA